MYPCSRIDGLMSEQTLAILDDLTALADITRDWLLLLLEAQELTVSELCTRRSSCRSPRSAAI